MTNKELALATPLGSSSLDLYFGAIRELPMLSAEEETRLARQLRDDSDLDAARELVLSNLRFVVHIARGYQGYGLALPDLIQEGNVGLMKAVKRFDPEVGVRLVSFAVHWIRAEIHEYVLRNWRIVKVATTKSQRKLFFNLRRAKKRLGWFSQSEIEAVAKDLGVKPETVLEMEKRLSNHDLAYDEPADADHDSSHQPAFAPAAYLQDSRNDPARDVEQADWNDHHTSQLHRALVDLDPRSQDIIQRRWLNDDKATLQELAGEYGVSAERIRQIESKAMKKLRGEIAA